MAAANVGEVQMAGNDANLNAGAAPRFTAITFASMLSMPSMVVDVADTVIDWSCSKGESSWKRESSCSVCNIHVAKSFVKQLGGISQRHHCRSCNSTVCDQPQCSSGVRESRKCSNCVQQQERQEQDQAAKIQKVCDMTPYAQLCANASEQVYTVNVPEILRTASLPGVVLRRQAVYASGQASNGCAVWSDEDHAVIAFKGTDNLDEFKLDCRTIETGTDETGEPFDICQIYNDHCVGKKKGVFITGHSLGGSRALHYGLQYVSQNKAEVHAFNPGSSMVEGLHRLVESFQTHVGAKSFVHHIGGDVISMGNQPKYGNITYIVYETKFRPHSILHFVDFNTIRVRTDLPENFKSVIMTYQTSDTITNHIGSRQANELGHDDLISISADQGNEEDFTLKFYDHTDTNVLFHWGTPSCSEITVKPGKHYIISYLDNAWSVEEVFSCFAYIRRNAGAV